MYRVIASVLLIVFLVGCDQESVSYVDPEFKETSVLSSVSTPIQSSYDLDDGHGFYFMEYPRASIEFRQNPERINVSLHMFPEAEFKDKNKQAYTIIKTVISTITGTTGAIVDDAIDGKIKGKTVVNGVATNVAGDSSLLFTFYP